MKRQVQQLLRKCILKQANETLLKANQGQRRAVIYADPPWKYTIEARAGTANSHYPTMALSDLKELRVQEVADKNCALFMWTTGPQMNTSLELMEAWGFRYTTMFLVWVKTCKGRVGGSRMGFYTRQSAEFVLLGFRGRGGRQARERLKGRPAVFNIIQEDSREHSRKPDQVRALIDQMWPEGSRIELFARQSGIPGWDSWGNEI